MNEKWVDLKTLSEHTGINYYRLRKMAKAKQIPSYALPSGKNTRFLFLVSAVNETLMAGMSSSPQTAE